MGKGVERTLTGGRLQAGKRLRVSEQMSADVGGATFAPDRAAIGGGGELLSTGGDVAVDFAGFWE